MFNVFMQTDLIKDVIYSKYAFIIVKKNFLGINAKKVRKKKEKRKNVSKNYSILGIENRIEQITANLLENSISFSDKNQFEWTEEEKLLTEKILNFVNQVADREDELYPQNEDNQKWFDSVIIYSLDWKYINTEAQILLE